jgi:hypothetical protein
MEIDDMWDDEEDLKQFAPRAAKGQAISPPYSNCKFRMCDLPGQCVSEGKCHHPTQPAPDCRTCEDYEPEGNAMGYQCLVNCVNGDQYQPAPKVVLWRTE